MGHILNGVNGDLSRWILSQFPDRYPGYAADIGASDGVSINSTWLLEKDHDWTVLCVEPNPMFHPAISSIRKIVEPCACGSKSGQGTLHVNDDNPEAYSALQVADHPLVRKNAGRRWHDVEVPIATLDQLLAHHRFLRLDALCIDVEGAEQDVMNGLDWKRWHPTVVVLESWDHGAHDQAMLQRGYVRVWNQHDNAGYVVAP